MPPQGITSFTVDPNSRVVVGQEWINNILALGTAATGPLLLRANVTADEDANDLPIDLYQHTFGLYQTPNNIESYALFTEEFDRFSHHRSDVNAPLSDPLNNPYIDDFSFRATDFAIRLQRSGLQRYFIWNEPNDSSAGNGFIRDPAHFAALLFQCYTRIKAHVRAAAVYMGGILWPIGAPLATGGVVSAAQATRQVADYLRAVYRHLQEHGGRVAWDAVNVHVHHASFTDRDMVDLRSAIDRVFAPADRRPVFVGEWGLTCGEGSDAATMRGAFEAIRDHFDAMWWFQHPTRDTPGACNAGDFGATRWDIQGGNFVPRAACASAANLKACYAAPSRRVA